MKTIIVSIIFLSCSLASACSKSAQGSGTDPGNPNPDEKTSIAEQNLIRAIELADKAVSAYFTGNSMKMARYYNPYTGNQSQEVGSVWMYTSAIEAANSILSALEEFKAKGKADLYNKHFQNYNTLLESLHENAAYYKGTFTLTSYTQTREWTVYGVNRGRDKGTAAVDGINNVYDDQQWLIRELIEAYKLTGKETYLREAEYLTEYVLDGWDYTLDANGKEHGGITWGPGYVTKHSCSNGPLISPLVWLSEIYRNKTDEISHIFIDADKKRQVRSDKKSDYYLDFAKKVYEWQKGKLLRSDGVYDDMMGGCGNCQVGYETIDGVRYRKHVDLTNRVGPPYSYNSGSMLSGAADLYRVTNDNLYLQDAKQLTNASFQKFAKLGATIPDHYTYDISGFNNWFNNVLLRAYIDIYPFYADAGKAVESFQKNLDYGYNKFLYKGMLPTNLLIGWNRESGNNQTEGMFAFSFASEYARLALHELNK